MSHFSYFRLNRTTRGFRNLKATRHINSKSLTLLKSGEPSICIEYPDLDLFSAVGEFTHRKVLTNMKRNKIAWYLWAIGTVLIALSWFNIVSNTVGWCGFVIGMFGSISGWGVHPPQGNAKSEIKSVAIISENILVESPATENDQQFCSTIEDMIILTYNRKPDWLQFSAGRQFIYGERHFREFVCVAGSVAEMLMLRAQKDGGFARALIYRADYDTVPRAFEIRAGIQTEIKPDELRVV